MSLFDEFIELLTGALVLVGIAIGASVVGLIWLVTWLFN